MHTLSPVQRRYMDYLDCIQIKKEKKVCTTLDSY